MGRIQLSQPSFANGFARSRGESVRPDLWPDHAWVPAFGCQGSKIFDLCGNIDCTTTANPVWANEGINSASVISEQNVLQSDDYSYFWRAKINNYSIVCSSMGSTDFLVGITDGYALDIFKFTLAYSTQNLILKSGSYYDLYRSPRDVTLCVVKSNLSAKMYVNGYETDYRQQQDAIGTPTYGTLRICSDGYASFNGYFKQCGVYNRILNAEDILKLHQDPYLPFRRRQPVFYSVPSAGGGNYSLTLDGSSYGISGTASQLIKATICGLATTSYEQSGTAAGLLRQLKVVGAGGIYEKSGTAAGLLALLKLISGSGSYETSGTINLLFHQLALTAGLTSYAISGTDVSLSAVGDSSLVVDPGGYEISGTTAALLRTLLLSAAALSYTKSGTAATLLRALSLGAVTASYTISGTAAELTGPPGAYILDASWSGARYWLDTEGNPILDTEGQPIVIYDDLYKIVPKVVGLLRTYPLSAGIESYSVSGIASDLLKLAKLISGHGAYDYSGRPISGGYQKLFAATGATYEHTGTAIDLSKTNSLAALAGSYSLLGTEVRFIPTLFMVGSGSYNLLGTQISTILSHVLSGTSGEYVLTGTDNPLYYGFFIIPQSGSYLSAGVDADLRMFSGLSSYGGSYLVSGNVSDLKFLHKLGLGSSQYDITGTDSDVLAVRALTLGSDSYVITGEDVAFDAFYLLTLGGGSYLLNGVPITFGSDYILYARPGTINYSGQIALLWYSAEIIGNVLMFLDIKTAEIILAVKSPQLILEFNERN